MYDYINLSVLSYPHIRGGTNSSEIDNSDKTDDDTSRRKESIK